MISLPHGLIAGRSEFDAAGTRVAFACDCQRAPVRFGDQRHAGGVTEAVGDAAGPRPRCGATGGHHDRQQRRDDEQGRRGSGQQATPDSRPHVSKAAGGESR